MRGMHMPMTENEVNAVFGLEPEAEDTGTEGAAIEPEGQDEGGGASAGDEGAHEGAGAENAAGADEAGEPGEGGDDAGAAKPPAGEQQRPDAETLERLKSAAEAQQRQRLDSIIRDMNLINPRTKEKIQSYADYEAYRAQIQSEQRSRDMKRLGLNEQQYQEWLNQQPEVREAREAAQAAKKREAEAQVSAWMREIHELDPSINEVADLGKMPNYPRFYELVRRNGLSFVDAYKLVNMDKLTQRNAEAARQAAINAAASKEHLKPANVRAGAANDVSVPKAIADNYRALDPAITDAEIKRDYAKFLSANKQKGA